MARQEERVPVGAASRYVGPDRRACPYLVLVSTLTPTKASRQLPRPFVVELKRRHTVIIGARQMGPQTLTIYVYCL